MKRREQDELMFLAAVGRDPSNDVAALPSDLLTAPWRRFLLDAYRRHPGDTGAVLNDLSRSHGDVDWLAKLEQVDAKSGLSCRFTNEQFAERILDANRRERLMSVYSRAAQACKAGELTAAEIRTNVQREQAEIECGTGRTQIVHVSDVIAETIRDIKDRMDGTKPVMTTGLPSLDKALGGGLEPGWMVVIGARPKMGKTGFAGLISQTNAKAGIPVFGCELEMSAPQQGRRIISRSGGPTLERVRTPRFKEDLERIFGIHAAVKNLPWHFTFTCRNFDQVEAAFREWRMLHTDPKKPAIGVLDYLQLAEGKSGVVREREVSDMARRCKLLAKELGIPIIVLCQLNREVERREPPRPQASDLRESGAIEQDADAILMFYRPAVYDLPGPDGRPDEQAVEILIPAQREGASGESVWARFIGERATFEERKQ